jgi:DNA-binding response OmpR family regulator
MRILVVEDDDSVAQVLKILLSEKNYAVDLAMDGESGLDLAEAFDYDLILLDVILPKMDGVSLCRQLRSEGYRMPILLLTGQDGSHEKAIALNTGADDYVVKPFDHEELIARIQALLRRGGAKLQPVLEWGDLRLDPSSRDVTYGSEILALTPKEHAILELFLRNNQRVLSPGMILDHAWSSEEAPGEEAVRVHIKGLRHKLKMAGVAANFIETVYGVGYRLNPDHALATHSPQTHHPQTHHPQTHHPQTLGPEIPTLNPGQQRVMVMTDDPELFPFLMEILSPQSLQVDLLNHGQNFWETLETFVPNLLVVDLDISDISKLALCQQVRHHSRWQGLPIICLIPNTDADLVKQIFAAGANDFVSKPVIGPEFVARIVSRL